MMTAWPEWFRYQLKAAAEGLLWALGRIDSELHDQSPPAQHYLGKWPPKRLLWHVTEYERCVSLASMRQWLGGSIPADDAWIDTDDNWQAVQDRTVEEFHQNFHEVDRAHMQLLDELVDAGWETPQETIWGAKPLSWVVTKTYQHRLEHTDTLLRMALRWRDALEAMARDRAAQQQ